MKRDKIYHVVAGALIAAAAGYLSSPAIGLTAGVITGAGKEAWDYAGNGTPEWGDFVATLMGAAGGAALIQ